MRDYLYKLIVCGVFCITIWACSYITWRLIGWEWSAQVYKDCLLYAVVWRVFQNEQ
jgi:hypothetical protein